MRDVTVLGRKIFIKSVSAEEMERLRKNLGMPEELNGLFVEEDNTVYIWAGVEGEFYKRILLHELFHAYLSFSGHDSLLGEEQEEALCKLSENLLELFLHKKFVEEMNA